jgi:DUF1365 family protein
MRSLNAQTGALAVNRRGLLSFNDTDHGDGRGPESGGAVAWLDALLQQAGISDAVGEAWLHCYPRVLGYTFKPVSFWYCHTADDSLRAIVVEVNNTFGERHCYLLDSAQLGPLWGHELTTQKVFHVSPFCAVSGSYRFRFLRSVRDGQDRTVVRIDHDDEQGPLLQTSVSGRLEPISAALIRHALWAYPAMTLGVVARIHWQALRLWLKRVRFYPKPEAPQAFVTR